MGESVEHFFNREVKPHMVNIWANTAIADHKDGQVGKIDCEINFNRYFYKYAPPRLLEVIEEDIGALGQETIEIFYKVTG